MQEIKDLYMDLLKIAKKRELTEVQLASLMNTSQSAINFAKHNKSVGLKLTSKLADALGFKIVFKLEDK